VKDGGIEEQLTENTVGLCRMHRLCGVPKLENQGKDQNLLRYLCQR
jgi:hypothetical protein